MAKRTLDGTGILSGVYDDEQAAAEREAAAKLEQATAARAAQEEALLNQLETALAESVREELGEELAERKLSDKTLKQYREDFVRFKAYCQHWSTPLPHLPASPQVVAAFLASEIRLGKAHVRRLAKVIARAHSSADLPNPCDDTLVRAVIRRASSEPQQTATTPSN